MDVSIVDLQEQPTAVVREAVAMDALPEFFGRAFAAAGAALEAQHVPPAGPPFAHYLSKPTETVDVEAGFPVATTVTSGNGVQPSTLPAGRAVQATHVGSYDTIGQTYEAVMQWMGQEGLTASEDMWECYLSEPAADPATQRTLIVWPIRN